MDLRNIIKAKKSGIDTGKWSNGHMSRPNWPSRKAKAKAYKWGPDYQWRVLQCDVDGVLGKCRVRLILNKRKQIFRATLGVTVDGETKTLCDYEYHASEPGWHCHARCDHLDSIDPATNRFGGARIPKASMRHRRKDFVFGSSEINELVAFNLAVKVYNIEVAGALM